MLTIPNSFKSIHLRDFMGHRFLLFTTLVNILFLVCFKSIGQQYIYITHLACQGCWDEEEEEGIEPIVRALPKRGSPLRPQQ